MTFMRLFSGDLPDMVERIGWVLVHSLWQFALLATVIALSLRAMRRSSSAARYGVLVVALATSVTAPMATWTLQPGTTRDHSASRSKSARQSGSTFETLQDTGISADSGNLSFPTATSIEDAIPDTTLAHSATALPAKADVNPPKTSWMEVVTAIVRPWLPWIVAGWIVGVVFCSLRPLLGWQMLRHLRTVGVCAVSDDVQAAMRRASDRLGLRCAVEVLQSTLVQVPVVVGYLRPVILLPVSLLTSIPSAQLEAILAHELAHVRRHDFAVNLLQTLIETLFFYHPAIWWLSHQIRVEREHCCDDLVVKSLGNHVDYGRALLAIAELNGNRNVLALGATDGSLLSRVRRIFGVRSDSVVARSGERWLTGLLGLVCLGLILALLFSSNLVAKNEDAKNPQPTFARLPDGIEVELVGVGFHPSKDRAWWTPDGGELRQRPRLEGERSVMPNSPQQAQCREFLIQIRGLPSNHSVKVDYGSLAAAAGSRYSDGLWTGEHAAGPFKSKVTSIRVGLTTEPYGPIVSFDATGRKQGLEKVPEELRACYGLLVPGGIEDSNGRIELLLENGPLNELGKLAAWELDAVDVDGKKHRSSSQLIAAHRNSFRHPTTKDTSFTTCRANVLLVSSTVCGPIVTGSRSKASALNRVSEQTSRSRSKRFRRSLILKVFENQARTDRPLLSHPNRELGSSMAMSRSKLSVRPMTKVTR